MFLHADTTFPEGGLSRIVDQLQGSPDAVGGNFRLVFDGRDGFSRWLTGFYAWIRRRGLYYGDSAVFVRRAVYDQLGGIRPLALMEDLEFNRRLERAGPTLCIEVPAFLTSSRKFRGRNPASIIVANCRVKITMSRVGTLIPRLAFLASRTRTTRNRF